MKKDDIKKSVTVIRKWASLVLDIGKAHKNQLNYENLVSELLHDVCVQPL